jgi:hypothetical protein
MRASGRFSVVALACLSNFSLWSVGLSSLCLSRLASAQPSDQVVAERVLGPQWKQFSRRAGMIFAGTVLATTPQTVKPQTGAAVDRVVTMTPPGTAPSIQLSFRVDKAIAGVEPGQILTIQEWAGAWAMQRPMRPGQHILIFLYPPSHLGFTSPVGGSMGQIALDASGKNVAEHQQRPVAPVANGSISHEGVSNESVSLVQLERAIRSAREE